MVTADGEIVYVGKSKRVRSRLLSYFRCAYPAEKGARILREADRLEWEYVPSEFAALLEELRLIKRYRPRFNVAMKNDARHFAFIKMTRGVAPKLAVVRGPGTDDGAGYYGPFNGGRAVSEAVRELNDVLGLRDCSLDRRMHFADQPDLIPLPPRTPGCIRLEISKCLGPCVGACTAGEYMSKLSVARAFLEGSDDAPVGTLRDAMLAASERLEFERAASLRDKLQRLEGLKSQFERYRFAIETLSFVYEVPGHSGEDRVYVIRRGRVRAESAAPKDAVERARLSVAAAEIFGSSERDGGQIPRHEVDEFLLLSAWFRKFPGELERTSSPVSAGGVERVS
jgi:excinuclease ABC subunit C